MKPIHDDLDQRETTNGNDLAEAAKLRYLKPNETAFAETEGGLLSLTVDGETHAPVYLHGSFPHTNKHQYISVRTADNKELGMIEVLDDFPETVSRLLEFHMNLRYFAPEITRVVRIREEFGYSYWEAETDKGFCRFTVRGGGGQVKLITEDRLLIIDVDGNRFVIPSLENLSEKEYRMVEMCM